ncbi:MAG: VWA-like domain-containing protein, partial [Candidatus Latescibacteria bacterium]|nr:VWA-like domain-containing protein [Candidatus Latescibacterota bacterium]
LVDTRIASTSEYLVILLEKLGVQIDSVVATCLLTGIVTDTLGFRTPNTTPDTLATAQTLMELGAPLHEIYDRTMHQRSLSATRLWGHALSDVQSHDGLVWASLPLSAKAKVGYTASGDADVVTQLTAIETTDVAVVFVERINGEIKISWRSTTGMNVEPIARSFGGGGHQAASGANLYDTSLADAERELNRAIVSAANIAKGRGQLPSYLGDQVTELVAPSRDWREILEDMLADTVPTDYSFETPNRFHLRSPIVMPSNDREGLGHVGIFVDASGSVSQGEYRQFMSDVADIFENLNPETATMIQFDCTAAEPETFEAGEEPDYVRRRNGGTHFPAPFDKAAEDGLLDDFDVIIVFTDGGDDSFPEEPNCPVIWASTGAFWGGTPPFGECVAVKFDD